MTAREFSIQAVARRCAIGLCISLLACTASASWAADSAAGGARAAIEPKIAELVGLVGTGRVDAMLERIGPIPEHERQTWEETRRRLANLYSNAGKYSGFEIAGYKSLTSRYHIAYVLVYFEKRPVLSEFGFYYVDDAWRPQSLRLETDFKAIVDPMPLEK